MTNLNFPVRRRTRDAYPVLRHKPEKIVVTLSPGDVLVFRKERGRREWHGAEVTVVWLLRFARPSVRDNSHRPHNRQS